MIDEHDEDEELYDEGRTWEELLGGALSPGDTLSEKYRVDELVGHGAMGFVLKAWHLQLDEPVAVKFLLPELAASEEALVRFEREARATFKIKSEHVARVLDVGRLAEGHPFMVMEYLEGMELADLYFEEPLPVGELCGYIVQACDAIAEAHALGIVHRDLKPDNLFLTQRRDGSTCVKVLDFGLSKVASTGDRRERAVTADAQVMGTAHYMSPEQWLSAKNVGPSTDIWALGVILYEGLTAESPFLRNNLAAMCNAVLRHDPDPVHQLNPEVPEALSKVVARCLDKETTERFATTAELGEALRPFCTNPSIYPTLPPPDAAPRIPAQSRTDVMMTLPSVDVAPSPAGFPRLGLRDGAVIETWSDILAEGEPASPNKALWVLAAVAAIIFAGLVGLFAL